MAISVDQIDLWRSAPKETEVLEFKAATNQYHTDKLCEYCVAIGNEGGGHLILGIQNAIPRSVVGTNAINDPGGMSEKILNMLGFRVHIEAVQHPAGRVVVVSIPGRPHGSAFHLDGKYLMRVGESLQPMTEDQLRRIFTEKEPDWLEEPTKTKLGPAQVLSLINASLFFKTALSMPLPSTGDEIMRRLVAEHLINDDGAGAYSIRRIAALLLAHDLKEFPELVRKAPRVTVYKGTTKLADPTDNTVGNMGFAVGFPGLLKYVNDRVPHREIIEDGLRKRVNIVPPIVVRELLANALVHQDLGISGTSVTVEIYEDRVQIANPGAPIFPVDRLIHEMRSRNERLADLMRRLGICEERGTGIDKIVDAAETSHLPAPNFRATQDRTVCTAYGPRGFKDIPREDRVRACAQHCALKWENGGRMTNKSLRERFKLAENQIHLVSQVITAAQQEGLIKPDQAVGTSRRLARYVPSYA